MVMYLSILLRSFILDQPMRQLEEKSSSEIDINFKNIMVSSESFVLFIYNLVSKTIINMTTIKI